jgi:hypothetical protein
MGVENSRQRRLYCDIELAGRSVYRSSKSARGGCSDEVEVTQPPEEVAIMIWK